MPDIGLVPADAAIYRQLDKVVDLSALTPKARLSAVIDEVKNSVDPPLPIVVLWRDLYDNADVEKTTEINMDGLSSVRLRTGLESLLKAVTGGFGEEIGYVVDDGVVTIATTMSLPTKLETRIYQVPAVIRAAGNIQRLANVIMETIEPGSWFEMSEEMGEGSIMSYLGTKLTISQTYEVHLKIQKLLKGLVKGVPVGLGPDVPVEALVGRLRELQKDKENLGKQVSTLSERRVELAKQRGRKTREMKAAAQKVLKNDAEAIIAALETLKRRIAMGTGDGPELDQLKYILAKVRMIPANVMREIDKSYSSYYSYDRSDEASVLGDRFYSKQSELAGVKSKIGRIDSLLMANRVIDPEVSQIRLAARRLEFAEGRVYELGVRLANLAWPSVVIIGAD
jgi:hypothetical protein